MLDITFTCPHCQQNLTVDESAAGSVVNCPSCEKQVQIPQKSHQAQPVAVHSPAHNEPQGKPKTSRLAVASLILAILSFVLPVVASSLALSKSLHSELWLAVMLLWFPSLITAIIFGMMALRRIKRSGGKLKGRLMAIAGTVISLGFGLLIAAVGIGTEMGSTDSQHGNQTTVANQSGPNAANATTPHSGVSMTDDQAYDYMSVKLTSAQTVQERLNLLNGYQTKFPNGKHSGAVRALLEDAEKEVRVGKVLFQCHMTLGGGQTIPVQGYLQLLRSDDSYEDVMKWMPYDSGVSQSLQVLGLIERLNQQINNIGMLIGQPKSEGPTYDILVSSIGGYLSCLKTTKVAEGNLQDGQLLFANIEPGEYLIYGAGRAGMNFVGYFDHIKLQGGQSVTMSPQAFACFVKVGTHLDFDHLFRVWKRCNADSRRSIADISRAYEARQRQVPTVRCPYCNNQVSVDLTKGTQFTCAYCRKTFAMSSPSPPALPPIPGSE